MTDDVTRGEGNRERGPREVRDAREADVRRDGVKGTGTVPGTRRTTDTTSSTGTTGTTSPAGGTSGSAGTIGTTRPAGTTSGSAGTTGTTSPAGGTSPAGATGTHAAVGSGHDRTDERSGSSGSSGSSGNGHLLPHDECDKLNLRMQHALGGFVDEPRSAVEEADHVLEEVTARFTDAMTQRRRTLLASWQPTAEDRATPADTEQLRLALRDYRELTERLLRL